MKKTILVLIGCLFLMSPRWAMSALGDQIKTTLLDHVQTVTQISDNGETKIALLDSIVQALQYKGEYLLNGQFGFPQNVDPDAGQTGGADFIAGLFVRLNPLVNRLVHYPDHWVFLQAIEHGPAWNYDFRTDENYFSYNIGLAFSLKPKK